MKQELSRVSINRFQKKIWSFYKKNRREFPWRDTRDPYRILISEVMLQQTQTQRVGDKYREFLRTFPNFKSLARASLPEVMRVWQGLGYNRRARFLLETAREVIKNHKGKLPKQAEELLKLPGIGKGTAGSVAAFAFNTPTVFIETNIRRVFISEFFSVEKDIPDEKIKQLVARTISQDNPREWYYALMDYGVYLSKTLKENPNRSSRHYVKQSTFRGSRREARGAILRFLLQHDSGRESKIRKETSLSAENIKEALRDLEKEGLISQSKGLYKLR